ncbi:hypothetical protein SNEBB_000481 [Seison nebaliae]|nr:hypothetical protein SNEBB_000481 [Seison nebaliae]
MDCQEWEANAKKKQLDNPERRSVDKQLIALQKNYRQLELRCRQYEEETNAQLNSKKFEIRGLIKERDELQENIPTLGQDKNKGDEVRLEREIEELQKEQLQLKTKIAGQKTELDELEHKIRAEQKKLNEQKHRVGGYCGRQNKKENLTKKIRQAEEKLHLATQRYNNTIKENAEYRSKITHLMTERKKHIKRHEELCQQLQNVKKEVLSVVNECTRVFDLKRDLQGKLDAVRDKNARDQDKYISKIRLLQSDIESNEKLKKFIENKLSKREKYKTEIKDIKSSDKANQKKKLNPITTADDFNDPEVQRMIEELYVQFEQGDLDPFSLFRHVNALTNEIQDLQNQIQQIESDIETITRITNETNSYRQALLQEMEEKYVWNVTKEEDLDQKIKEDEVSLQELFKEVEETYKYLDCHSDDLRAYENGEEQINESNVIYFLKEIELRANKYMTLFYFSGQETGGGQTLQQGGSIRPSGQTLNETFSSYGKLHTTKKIQMTDVKDRTVTLDAMTLETEDPNKHKERGKGKKMNKPVGILSADSMDTESMDSVNGNDNI